MKKIFKEKNKGISKNTVAQLRLGLKNNALVMKQFYKYNAVIVTRELVQRRNNYIIIKQSGKKK